MSTCVRVGGLKRGRSFDREAQERRQVGRLRSTRGVLHDERTHGLAILRAQGEALGGARDSVDPGPVAVDQRGGVDVHLQGCRQEGMMGSREGRVLPPTNTSTNPLST